MSKLELALIINTINKIWVVNYSKSFKDISNKLPLYNFVKEINNIKGVSDVNLDSAKTIKYKDFDSEPGLFQQYHITVSINNIKITGFINLIPNYDEYNIVICLKLNDKLNEAFNILNEELNFKSFISELKKCKNFEDIKNTVKKYCKEGIVLGTLLTVVLCNFTLSDPELMELGNLYQGNVVHAELFYVLDDEMSAEEFYGTSNKPSWKLLCDDAETTVYHAKKSQCNSDVLNTASMFRLNLEDPESHKIIAMERTMMKLYGLKYGDLVKIEGTDGRDGIYQIQDTMNKRFAGKHKIDILINNNSKIGKWNNVKIYKLVNPLKFYKSLKSSMVNALNQKQVDLRLGK